LTEQEKESIRQSMEDGYFMRYAKQPKPSEINACLRFFEGVDVIRNTKEPETVDLREKGLITMFYMVINRDVLISDWDSEKQQPVFIKNDIQIQ